MEGYTAAEQGKIREIILRYHKTGHPEWIARLELQLEQGVPFEQLRLPEHDVPRGQPIRPETNVAVHLLEVPPRTGKGSSSAAWRQFARLTTNIPSDVLDNLGREEIIPLLIERDVIEEDDESPWT